MKNNAEEKFSCRESYTFFCIESRIFSCSNVGKGALHSATKI